jgi:uncharacterized protein (DUF1499 family)
VRWRIATSVAALAAVGGAVMAVACAGIPDDIGLVDGRLRSCPESPNCVCSETPEAESFVEPFAFAGDGPAALESLIRFLESEPRIDVVSRSPDYAHVVFRTAVLRFRDDVELRLDEAAGVIHVRSASRIGYSDLGVNRDRIESIRARWSAPAPPTEDPSPTSGS